MTKEISMGLRKKFAKDYKLPFKTLTDPHFDYFLDLYEKNFGFKKHLASMLDAIECIGGESEFNRYYNDLYQGMIDYVKATDAYKLFNEGQMPVMEKPKWNISKDTPYSSHYKDELFVSIDLVKANFQVMQDFDRALVDDYDTYKDFISRFTPHEYFHNSKQIRQIIFGNLNPKRQQGYQKRIMADIIAKLFDSFEEKQFRGLTSDEVFVQINKENFNTEIELIRNKLKGFPYELRIELFKIVPLGNKCFVKEIYDEVYNLQKVEFKNVPGHLFAQAFKKYYDLPLNENDLTFIFEGQEAVLKNPCF